MAESASLADGKIGESESRMAFLRIPPARRWPVSSFEPHRVSSATIEARAGTGLTRNSRRASVSCWKKPTKPSCGSISSTNAAWAPEPCSRIFWTRVDNSEPSSHALTRPHVDETVFLRSLDPSCNPAIRQSCHSAIPQFAMILPWRATPKSSASGRFSEKSSARRPVSLSTSSRRSAASRLGPFDAISRRSKRPDFRSTTTARATMGERGG